MSRIILEIVGEPMADKFQPDDGDPKFIEMHRYNPFGESESPKVEYEAEMEVTLSEYQNLLSLDP